MESSRLFEMIGASPAFQAYKNENDELPELVWNNEQNGKLSIRQWNGGRNYTDSALRVTLGDVVVVTSSGFVTDNYRNSDYSLIIAEKIENGDEVDRFEYPLALIRTDKKEINICVFIEDTEAFSKMLDFILEKALPLLDKTAIFPVKLDFPTALEHFYSAGIISKEDEKERQERNAKDSLRSYLVSVRLSDLATVEKQALEKVKKEKLKNIGELESYLKKHKKIFKYSFKNEEIMELRVHELKLSYEGETILLPPMIVEINIKTGGLFITLDKRRMAGHLIWGDILSEIDDNNYHPHVRSEGGVCMGNFAEVYATVIASGEFVQVIELVLEFLQTYNHTSVYNNFGYYSSIYPLL